MSFKKTKGKQKIMIKKIDRYEDRLVTLSKRRNSIYTKLCEISVLCGANVAFLGYTSSGKPYTFGTSSSSSSLQQSILDAHYKEIVQEFCTSYNNMVELARADEMKTMKTVASVELFSKDTWWKEHLMEKKDQEENKQFLEKFEGLYEKLCDELDARS
ncbi:hypothetical protein CARUB_v10012479mg [Capsella rubella]|uniref:MADS-box domain-containing protein n=1 Tax=Capsella rubella TaxID=81985 RepID=R0GTY1_9BRAS|nr:hypothetical protein CARUB_v10012479mg [Capsella rubella]